MPLSNSGLGAPPLEKMLHISLEMGHSSDIFHFGELLCFEGNLKFHPQLHARNDDGKGERRNVRREKYVRNCVFAKV